MINKFRLAAIAALAGLLVMAILPSVNVFAAASVTTPATTNITSDSFNGTSVALPALGINEGLAGDINAGVLTWALPTGFVLDTTSVANVATSGNGLAASTTVAFPDSTHFSVSITSSSTAPATLTVGSATPIRVKVASSSPLAATGNITLSSGSVAGLGIGSIFATLSQTPGVANKLAFTSQPPTTVTAGAVFSTQVGVQDQFGNLVTTDSGRNINLSAISNSLAGSTTVATASGIANFTNLTLSTINTTQLQASTASLVTATSNNVAVTATSTGPVSQLVFTTQPASSIGVNSTFPTVTVSAEDSSGNVVTSDSGRTITLSFIAVNPATTTGVLSGTLTINDASGQASFTNLSFSANDTIVLQAGSSGLPSVNSSNVNVSSSSSTGTACGLADGTVVQVQGSQTVYLVVGCVLRPFPNYQTFKSRGKKDKDIRKIMSQIFRGYGIGRPVGQGSDNDHTIVIPPVTTTTTTPTPPVISGLPDGSIVKLPGNPTVYMVSGGQLQPFTSAVALLARGKSFKDITVITPQQFSQLTVGAPVSITDNTLLQGSGSTVYVTRGGKLYGITSLGVLQKNGWSLNKVVHVKDSDLRGFSRGGNQD